MRTVYVAVAALQFLLSSAHAVHAQQEEPHSSITVLVDLSETWLNKQSTRQNEQTLITVAKAIVTTALDWRSRVAVRFVGIGDLSFLRPPLCVAIFEPKLLAPKNDGGGQYFHTTATLRAFLETECNRFILTRQAAPFTDISGAIGTAIRLADDQVSGPKALIILSDMKEELRRKQEAADIHLAGFSVLMLYRGLNEDRLAPKVLDDRLSAWRSRLETAGAKVHVLSDLSVTPPQIQRLISN